VRADRTLKLGIVLAMVVPGVTQAQGGSLRVSPIRIELEPNATANVEFRNEGDAPLAMEIEARSWRQSAQGEDIYTPTRDLVFYPMIAEVDPGESRTVRLTRPDGSGAEGESAYRLYLRQIPVEREGSRGVAVLLGMSLPVFVQSGELRPDPSLEALELEAGRLRVPIRNRGTRHVRVEEVRVEVWGSRSEPLSSLRIPGWYVLPGAVRAFEAKLPEPICTASRLVRVHVQLVEGSLAAELKPDPARCADP
jgi:fimbrial chaperone protein